MPLLFRAMREGVSGKPQVGPSARTLGVRPGIDILEDTGGRVVPNTGGMSVSPESPMHLPAYRRPPVFGGTGRDPVWSISDSALGPDLQYRLDHAKPESHGFIEPARPMTFDQYQHTLEATQNSWNSVVPSWYRQCDRYEERSVYEF